MQIADSGVISAAQRLSAVAIPSAVTTVLLFLIMLTLIATDELQLDEVPLIINSVIMDPPADLEILKDPTPEKPADPEQTPQWQPPLESVEFDPLAQSVASLQGGIPMIHDRIDTAGGGGIVAYLKPAPIYPNRALQRGIEGFVDLAFDITAAGRTSNIRVIQSEPEGVFEKSAVAALKKWKYKVPSTGGEDRGQRDMMTRISFAIEG